MKYLLDTHTWIWWHTRPAKLSAKVKGLISRPARYEELLLSAISVWEFCKLLEKGRLALSCETEDWIQRALDVPNLRLVPLTPSIAYHSTVLQDLNSSDPADQIIVATARDENATILTKDKVLRDCPHVLTKW
ncbi:MAG: type II toxin-antitoxin system VapC family toxin [Candidatus Hydrogenedentes bacterium]|nr:type II toxin-antitoxin system VapC family toxin [Candidatus Hydrogenedentota bacterium]